MLDPQTSRFWQSTLLSGLMDAQGLAACWNAIPPEKRVVAEHLDRRLARQAVHSKALTLWQAQQLLAGRTAGYRVDRYVLLDLIGQGGMGRVYLAQDSRLNRRVALKILAPERVNNPRAIARFQREARVGAQLQHENLVRIYDFGESNGRYYLVMEYIEGKTIGTLISEGGAMPPAPAVRLVRQVALGLEHAHRKGLIHRDVNPYNILVTRDGTAKLADLGLAIDLAEEDRVTREGATVGTFDYVAPEQARHSHSADIRSDIYSLGCTIYHMCTGQVPFPTPSLPEKLFAHQAMEPEAMDKLAPGLPEGLAEVVQRMMHKSPDERYATPLQVAQALERFCEDHDGGESHDGERLHSTKPEGETTAPPVPINETTAGAPFSAGTQGALGQVNPVTPSAALKTPSGVEDETGTGPDGRDHVPPLFSAADDGQLSDPDFPLGVDLGPEPSLGERLSRPKSRSASNDPVVPAPGRGPFVILPRHALWGLAALTTLVMIMVAVLATINPGGSTDRSVNQRTTAPGGNDFTRANSKQTVEPDSIVAKSAQNEELPIVVRIDGGNDKEYPANKLREAIDDAIGFGCWVELRNSKPLVLSSDHPLDFNTNQGKLRIRAATGFEPVIAIDLKKSNSFLTTGSGLSVTLIGITFEVRYPDAKMAGAPAPPALIRAAGFTKIDRCAFRTVDPRVRASCAVYSDGGMLEATNSWFEGFDKAIEIDASNRTRCTIEQTMIVQESCKDPAQAPLAESYGWGVKLSLTGAARPPADKHPHLTLNHCTVQGGGLLDLTGSKGAARVQADVNECVVRTNALLAVTPERPPAARILWRGKSNQYDILGRSWLVRSANEGSPLLSIDVTDLVSWSKAIDTESTPIGDKVKFRINPAARPDLLRPHDFAIEAPGGPQSHPGADPDQVGPWSSLKTHTAVTVKK